MLGALMAEEVLVVNRPSTVKRRLVEGSIGMLLGLGFACVNGPWLLSLLYTPPSGDALSCGPTVSNALAYFVKLQLIAGLVGGGILLLVSFLLRRMWRNRSASSAAPTA
jgi:hypothetical protein